MPLIEYRCKDCDHVTELLTKMGDDPQAECEECGGETEKLFSAFTARVAPSAPAANCDACPNSTCPMR